MDVKELRIGNYLKTDRECQDDYVEVVEIYNENYFCTCSAGLNYQKEHVKPIPLTEEWLVKFGFKKLTMDKHFCDMEFELTHPLMRLYWDGRISMFQNGNTVGLNNIKHVHQLQNLYYSLTQKELIWKKYI